MMSVSFRFKEQELLLLPEKAIFWKEEKALLIADPHFGKITHFRKAGIALPGKAAFRNLLRLEKLIKTHRPQQVIFLGDLFHSEMNSEWLIFKELLRNYAQVDFQLVQGNHDILHETSYANSHFRLYEEPVRRGPFWLSHEPEESELGYNLCGHLHPGVNMVGAGRQSLRFPCFYFGEKGGVLPAFGEFTGLHLLKPQKGDSVFIVTEREVIKAA